MNAETAEWEFYLWVHESDAQISVCYMWNKAFRDYSYAESYYTNARDQIDYCRQKNDEYKQQENYYIAVKQMEYDSIAVLSQAKATFESMIDYKDSRENLFVCNQKIVQLKKQEEKKNRKGIKNLFKK